MKYSSSATVKAHSALPSETPLRCLLILQLFLFFVLSPQSDLFFLPVNLVIHIIVFSKSPRTQQDLLFVVNFSTYIL